MIEILKLASTAGFSLAALGTGLIYSIHAEWIKTDVFSKLSSDQTYKVLLLSLAITFISFILLIIVQIQAKRSASISVLARDHGTAINNTGNGNITITKEKQ